MRKKFLSAFMLGLLALGTAGTITSCKDYDGDISSLKNDLSTLNSNLTSQLNDLKSTLAAQKSELETKIATAKTELQAAIDQKADKTTVEALAARVSTLETELVTVKSRLDLVEADIATLKATVAEKADKTELEAAKTALETKIADAKSALQAAIDLKADKTVTDALEAEITALKNRVQALESSVQALENGKVDKTEFAEYKLQVAADISTINGEIETLKGAIEELKGVDADLAAKILAEVAARTTADEALAQALAAAVEAQGEVNDEVAQKIADLVVADGQLQEQITTLAGVVEALSNKEKLDIENLSSKLDALKASTLEALNALADQIADFKEQVAATYATKASVSELETNLKTLMQNADDAVKTALTTKINDAKDELNESISLVSGDVDVLSFLVAKRLTSIYFMPSTYIDGVEAITFNSLRYSDWSKDPKAWYANRPAFDADIVTIGDKTTKAEYYLNPTGVDASCIDTLSFIANKATNIKAFNRAGDAAPIAVSSFEIKDNKLTAYLVQTDSIYTPQLDQLYPFSKDWASWSWNFTIVSLKATLDKSVLTAEEKAAGNDVNVYSDWARVIALVNTPYIHDARAYDEKTGQIDEYNNGVDYDLDLDSEGNNAHFFEFGEIYPDSLGVAYQYDNRFIAAKVRYDQEFDLNTLMMICDKNGTKIDADSYGFHFEYATPEYYVYNENQTSDSTNQAKYITLNGSKIKSKTARGLSNNRDAIGKTPVIQVRLVDEKGRVADVRYFKVEWVDQEPTTKVLEPFEGEKQEFAGCGNAYTVVLGEDYLNGDVYAVEGEKGMKQLEFHANFNLDDVLYKTEKDAKTGNETNSIGLVEDDYSASQSTQAHNITALFDGFQLTKKLYEGTDTTLVGYARYVSIDGTQIRIIPISVTIGFNQAKPAYDYNYNSSYWTASDGKDITIADKNKYVVVNPTLETSDVYGTEADYTDAQMIYDLKNAYIKDKKAPTKINQLLKNVDTEATYVVIDSTRLDILPKKAETDVWTVEVRENSNSFVTLLKYNGVIAARLNGKSGIIRLEEKMTDGTAKYGVGGQPTEGALLLVNYDAKDKQTAAQTKNAVPVAVVSKVKSCDYDVTVDQFLVRFEQPLTFTANAKSVTVKDQIPSTSIGSTTLDGSVSTTDVTAAFTIKEAFGPQRTVNTPALKSWYIVDEAPTFENTAILINVDGDGNILGDDTSKWTNVNELFNSKGQQLYQLNTVEVAGKTYVQFINLHGNALTKDLKAIIPVSIGTKWRKGVSYNVNITIKQNTSTGTNGAKK